MNSASSNTAVYPAFKASLRRWLAPWKAYLDPHSKYRFVAAFNIEGKEILDIGCGVDSVRKLKVMAPKAQFDGVDIEEYQMSEAGKRAMRAYHIVSPQNFWTHIAQGPSYDAMVLSHVIEHLDKPKEFLDMLLTKLKPGGGIYISTPCMQSIHFMSLRRGCLNFYDDPTHKAPMPLIAWADAISPAFQASKKVARNYGHPLVFVLGWVFMPWVWLTRRKMPWMWYAKGFETVVVIRR